MTQNQPTQAASQGQEQILPEYQWSQDDSIAANAQGWNLYDALGDMVELQLQVNEHAAVFTRLEEAAEHVQRLADIGNPLGVKAIQALIAAGSSHVVQFDLKLPDAQVVTLPDGYNGQTMRFYSDPIEVDGETVKLRCAEPRKWHLIAWRSAAEVRAAVVAQAERKLPETEIAHATSGREFKPNEGRISAERMIAYLSTCTLEHALWWFIENVESEQEGRTDVFFYLRERFRNEAKPNDPLRRKAGRPVKQSQPG